MGEGLRLSVGNQTIARICATIARNSAGDRMCHRRAKAARNGTKTAKSGHWRQADNSARYVTRHITPRNVCSTRMFHGRCSPLVAPTELPLLVASNEFQNISVI